MKRVLHWLITKLIGPSKIEQILECRATIRELNISAASAGDRRDWDSCDRIDDQLEKEEAKLKRLLSLW